MLALLLLGACTGGLGDDTSGLPTLTLLSPADGDTVCGVPLHVVADVQNFTLTNETMEDPPPNTGHMHVFLNGQEVAQVDTETVDIEDYPAGGDAGVDDGEWQLGLDLALADHSALDPFVGLVIYISVDHSLCPD